MVVRRPLPYYVLDYFHVATVCICYNDVGGAPSSATSPVERRFKRAYILYRVCCKWRSSSRPLLVVVVSNTSARALRSPMIHFAFDPSLTTSLMNDTIISALVPGG